MGSTHTICLVTLLSLHVTLHCLRAQPASPKSPLFSIAQKARESGKDKADISAGSTLYASVQSLDEAAAIYRVVVAEPIETKAVAEGSNILTWYIFKISETISAPKIPAGVVFSYPKELGEIPGGHFAAAVPGGELTVDGVTISSKSEIFPALELGKKYLMFTLPDSFEKVAVIQLGPGGIFPLSHDGSNVSPLVDRPAPLLNDVRKYRSLNALRAEIKRPRR